MKRTKNKLMTIIILSIVLASFLIGAIAVTSFRTVTNENNHEILLHYCKENAETMNKRFTEIETLVNTLSDYYLSELVSPDKLINKSYRDSYTRETGKIAYSLIQNNESIVSIYYRLNPELSNPKAGYFISRNAESSTPIYKEPTDLSKYDSSDTANVGWYYIPIENGGCAWLEPYENTSNGIYMISYVQALYDEDTLIGVVGIDLDYDVICKEVGSISLYDSGYAILLDQDGSVLYSENHDPVIPQDIIGEITDQNEEYVYSSYIQQQQLYITMSHKMGNGEYLVLIVPEREIYSTRNQMVITIILIAIAVSTMVILVLTGIINRILNSTRIDKLTGAYNRNAYLEKVGNIENAIHSQKNISFAIVVFDINNLKSINDNIGHAAGDRLIINGYKSIKKRFGNRDIYRIGGDEFVIFIEKRTASIAEKLVTEFRNHMVKKCRNNQNHPENAIVSCGYALYNPETDASCEDTFTRADKEMYEDKARFYEANPQLKRRQ